MAQQTIRGFRDILPPQSNVFYAIEKAAREVFSLYNYDELRIPALEYYDLFLKSTGETTDIVQKEMYRFKDASQRDIALRPEGTPGVARAYINNNLSQTGKNSKYFYIADMFRAERPQAGRYRQFEQIGAENIGAESPYSDAESVSMLYEILKKLGIENFVLEINSLGCSECRKKYREELLSYLKGKEGLCEWCKERMEKNPLRTLDCKVDADKFVDFPKISLCESCSKHHEEFKKALSISGVKYVENPRMVRGLDYYSRTVFEFKNTSIGAQDAIAGGGRYDNLIKSMGGPDAPSVGWAMGVDRVAILLEKKWSDFVSNPLAFIVSMDKELSEYAFEILCDLRKNLIPCDFSDFSRSFKSQLRSADKSMAAFAVIIGKDEANAKEVTLKDLKSKEQKRVKKEELVRTLSVHF